MKKNITMKKSNFINGAFVTTLGIIITKLLGVIYVIPFHLVVGDVGGELYGYAYTVYIFFLSISTAGIPLSISKIVAEYQALGFTKAKNKVLKLSSKLAIIFGIISAFILFILSPIISELVLGNINTINTKEDVTLVIRVVSLSLLVVPFLSVYRGYFEGHRIFNAPSISQVIEQIVRIIVIVMGCFIVTKILNLDLSISIATAISATFIGALVAILYLLYKANKNKKVFKSSIKNVNEPIVKDKDIYKKIIMYAIPFILIDFFKSFYNYIDMFTVVKNLVNIAHFTPKDAEIVMSMISTWANKFNMAMLSISTGIVVSLIPTLATSLEKKDYKDVSLKINQGLSLLLFLMIPISILISFLSNAIWMLFYGSSTYGPSVLSFFIFVGLASALLISFVTILQSFKDIKWVLISLISGILVKLLFNSNLIYTFYSLNIPSYYGIMTSTILGYLTTFIISVIILKRKYKINFEESTKQFLNIIISSIIMLIVLLIINIFIPNYSTNRLLNIIYIIIFGIISLIVYLISTYKLSVIKSIFGNKINKFKFIKK